MCRRSCTRSVGLPILRTAAAQPTDRFEFGSLSGPPFGAGTASPRQMHHAPRAKDIAIGLGSHDIGVAEHTADLYHQGMFPLIVFTGANAPTTIDLFPRGEAVHYAERAAELGVPRDAILTETRARNTGENFTRTKDLLHDQGIDAHSATIISRPYQQRRAYATARKLSGLTSTSPAPPAPNRWPTTSPRSVTQTGC